MLVERVIASYLSCTKLSRGCVADNRTAWSCVGSGNIKTGYISGNRTGLTTNLDPIKSGNIDVRTSTVK